MKNQFLMLSLTFICLNCFGQITFDKGYYIDNSNKTFVGLIKNIDWKENPTSFKFKLSLNGQEKEMDISNVKEFGIDNASKYIRVTVNIDKSSEDVKKLSNTKMAIFNEEQLFLKVLIEGKANLYFYQTENLRRYFYNKDASNIAQLIYKRYSLDGHIIEKNNRYRQQLWNNLSCQTISQKDVDRIDYKKSSLVKFFVKYNQCHQATFINFDEKVKRDLFNLAIRPGINSSSLSIQNTNFNSLSADFGNKIGFRLGLEFEFVLPFNKNTWALLVEPTYQYFNSEKELSTRTVSVDYSSIELPLGVRHNIFLNSNSKIFLNALYIIDFSGKSMIDYSSGSDLEIETNPNIAIGLGYKQFERFSMELRYHTNREILGNYVFYTSDYSVISVIFGVNIF